MTAAWIRLDSRSSGFRGKSNPRSVTWSRTRSMGGDLLVAVAVGASRTHGPAYLTPQQRTDALAKAAAARTARAEMLAAVKTGHLTAAQVLETGQEHASFSGALLNSASP